jgi:hypothetical protein
MHTRFNDRGTTEEETMRSASLATFALVSAFMGLSSLPSAQAATLSPPAIEGPSLIEPVACRTVRQRVVRPNGSVVYRFKRQCGLVQVRPRRHCTVIKERIRRANGTVVFRSIRRCK